MKMNEEKRERGGGGRREGGVYEGGRVNCVFGFMRGEEMLWGRENNVINIDI